LGLALLRLRLLLLLFSVVDFHLLFSGDAAAVMQLFLGQCHAWERAHELLAKTSACS
jgi:hypothetical protein